MKSLAAVTIAAPGAAWVTTSLAASLPSWARCALLYVPASCGARKVGATSAVSTLPSWIIVPLDSSQQASLYGTSALLLLGYGDATECVWVDAETDVTPAGTTGWQLKDLSASIPTTAQGVVLLASGINGTVAGMRTPDVTTDVKFTFGSTYAIYVVTGVNSSREVSLYKTTGDAPVYKLLAYLTKSFVFFTGALETVTPGNTTWDDKTSAFTEMLLLHMAGTGVSGVRRNGDTVTPVTSASGAHPYTGVTGLASDTYEAYGACAGMTLYKAGIVRPLLEETMTLTGTVSKSISSSGSGQLSLAVKLTKLYDVRVTLK